MEDYFNDIEKIENLNINENDLTRYEEILVKIERGTPPSENELKDLDKLHDALKSVNKLDTMPNRSQAFLENYLLEQELKKNLPSNLQMIFQKLKNASTLEPFEAFYLLRKVKNEEFPQTEREKLAEHIRKYSSELAELSYGIDGLLDKELIGIFERLLEKIKNEQYRIENPDIYFDSKIFGLHSVITEAQGQHRLKHGKAIKNKLIAYVEKGHSLEEIVNLLRIHRAVDLDQISKYDCTFNDGSAFYVPDSRIKNATEATEAYVAKKSHHGEGGYFIYVIEYNPEIGAMLSIFRHLRKVYVDVGYKFTGEKK